MLSSCAVARLVAQCRLGGAMASRMATFTLIVMGLMACLVALQASPKKKAALGIDVDFYTGPISRDVWLRMKKAGLKFVVAQAWGGRSRNEFAASQLAGARSIGGMK